MNSHALIKIDTRQGWLERMLGLRGSRLLLVTGGTAAVVLSIPSPLIEQIATSMGLNEISQLFEPPIGMGTRILLAGGLALVPAAIVWALWAPRRAPAPIAHAPSREADGDYEFGRVRIEVDAGLQDNEDIGDADDMILASKQVSGKQGTGSGWGAIIRLVRGGFQEGADGQDAVLPRRRRDRHPDAPPRPPLFASRDLPPHDTKVAAPAAAPIEIEPSEPATLSEAVAFAPSQPAISVAPPPRSPDPMSDMEIARMVAAMPRSIARPSKAEIADLIAVIPTKRPIATAPAAPAPTAPVPAPHAPATSAAPLMAAIDLPLIDGADLAALAARFEHGLQRREVIAHAQEAQQSLDSRIALVQSDPFVRDALRAHRPMEVVSASPRGELPAIEEGAGESTLRLDADVEHALNNALATLRKLTEQGRR